MGNLERPKQFAFTLDKERLDREREKKERRKRGVQQQPKPGAKRKGEKPINSIFDGCIVTKIFENKKPNGKPDWKIEQVRIYQYGDQQDEAKTFRHENLEDARNGLFKAGLWIEKEERHRGLRRRSWWWPFS